MGLGTQWCGALSFRVFESVRLLADGRFSLCSAQSGAEIKLHFMPSADRRHG